ncbi:putative membrane protein [Enterococcus sp. PF1-24]|uniref:DUF1648 domain-containing protein n=1 Tax=unclassified Enterococcus TaxID=2608891 RepID=UPI0024754E90|nr:MULTISPECIES: DUF1648 domain-containing protein [unclassified Enterococcus]MDH6363472.1 putative membrane protein [Enterococcus sp. PFB1-1]MDH6400566.1 putative membrane protein [Enterococcus sp. PF1-24]
MKNRKKFILKLLMFLPLLLSLLALRILPSEIPGHYGLSGDIDRWGIKYEVLILPIFMIIMGSFLLIQTKKTESSVKMGQILSTGILSLGTLNILNIYIIISSYKSVSNLSDMSLDIFNLAFILIGVSFLFLGNILPKSKIPIISTSTSEMKYVSQLKKDFFVGATYMICGIVFILLGLFTNFSNIVYLLIFVFVSLGLLIFRINNY